MLIVCNRGGKVRVFDGQIGYVFLQKDWKLDRLPVDLVEEAGLLGAEFTLLESHQRGKLAGYSKIGEEAHFLVKDSQYPFIDRDNLSIYLACELNGWPNAIGDEKWRLLPDENNWHSLRIKWEELFSVSPFQFKFITSNGIWLEPQYPCSNITTENENNNYLFDVSRSGEDILSFSVISVNKSSDLDYWINFKPSGSFGYTVEKKRGRFRVFAPRAQKVELILHKKEDEFETTRLSMVREEDGSWVQYVQRKWERNYYNYIVFNECPSLKSGHFEKKILDPYAKATTGRDGFGIILPPATDDNLNDLFSPPPMSELIILETHLRDLLAKAPIELTLSERLEFNGLTKWLCSSDCYLREIGVNAVELQPIQEFDSRAKEEYHWGYMPVNYFSPESSYASDPNSGVAIQEFKALVEAFHSAGISVILDVVYNHVGIPVHLFNLDRELYFRIDEQGKLENHSGCGNDLNCESEPTRKLILDSLEYLVKVFDIDGFRFDLGELLGVDFLRLIEERMSGIKKNLILIAEPWSFRGRLPSSISSTGFALWNDECREEVLKFVKGEGNENMILQLLKGEMNKSTYPWQAVNYIESHDDFTFVDRLCDINEFPKGIIPTEVARKSTLALSILLLSPGIPMIAAGQDLLRNKKGNRNTYQRSDLNEIEYKNSKQEIEFSRQVRKLIEFRRSENGCVLRPNTKEENIYEEWKESPEGVIGLFVEKRSGGNKIMIVINSNPWDVTLNLPQKWNSVKCTITGEICPKSLNPHGCRLLERMN
ncbi:MAG: hypothetical protein CMI27_04065 [Opitutae bacterium]|nr:hypothetical protein [Opitutae bacterium]